MARSRDDDDDLPRRRRRDEDDDEDDDRPRRKPRRDDDEDDDRPRRRRRRRQSSGGGSGPLDGMFAGTNIVVIILFALCCPCISELLSFICLLTGEDRDAKQNAMICLIIALIVDFLRVMVFLAQGVR